MTADRRFDHTRAFARFARDQREVSFFDAAFRELNGQPAMRLVVLGHDETTARVFIEPMNNAGPLFAANSGQERRMMKQRIDQRVLPVTGARMHDQAGRFVQDEKIIVFKKNFERDRFRLIVDLFQRRLAKIDMIAGADEIARPGPFAVAANEATANQLLKARTRIDAELIGEKTIEPKL